MCAGADVFLYRSSHSLLPFWNFSKETHDPSFSNTTLLALKCIFTKCLISDFFLDCVFSAFLRWFSNFFCGHLHKKRHTLREPLSRVLWRKSARLEWDLHSTNWNLFANERGNEKLKFARENFCQGRALHTHTKLIVLSCLVVGFFESLTFLLHNCQIKNKRRET